MAAERKAKGTGGGTKAGAGAGAKSAGTAKSGGAAKSGGGTKSGGATGGKSGGDTKSARGATKTTPKARGGLATAVKPDSTLAAVVGDDAVTRAALTKKVWDYVKKNDLQDPKDRRTIRADEKLRPVFGGKDKVSMFEMTKLVNQHVGPA